jgi:hypothetical protein
MGHESENVLPSILALGLLAACSGPTLAAAENRKSQKAEAKVTQLEAEKTALAKIPGGSIKSAELEKEGGKLVWSFDIATPKSRNLTEVQVDAKVGTIVSTEIETPRDEAKEAEDEGKPNH